MNVAGKTAWLESGLVILGTSGPTGLTIDKLVATTGLSTGSFYHHFSGMSGYKSALLAYFEDVHTLRYIREVEAAEGRSARERLQLLIDLVLASDEPANIELAISAWAISEPLAASARQQVDKVRSGFLRTLLLECGYTEPDATAIATTLYLLVLGAGHIRPPVPPDELRVLYARVVT